MTILHDNLPPSGSTYGELAPRYRESAYWPRPVKFGTKRPPMPEWEIPDPARAAGEVEGWDQTFANHGIGLLLGSPFPDGTRLAALDIDRDDYVRIGQALLRNPPSARIGAKGIAIFARLRGDGSYRGFSVKRGDGKQNIKVCDFLCDSRFCVLPPTIYPKTENAYRWVGKPLLEVDYRDLPIIEA